MTVLLLVVSMAVVVLGAELLVRGASLLALRAGLSPLVVGLTIVGFGTSLPELGASMAASLVGSSDVSVGNVVGSNIFNMAVVLGLTALIHPIRIHLAPLRRDFLIALVAALVPFSSLALGATIPRWLGILLLTALAGYVTVAYRTGRRATVADRDLACEEVEASLVIDASGHGVMNGLWANLLGLVLGLALLAGGSQLFVRQAIELARRLGAPELLIGLTVVAVGTSLPELVTSVTAARRKSPDIAVGNVIGSNIFNILGILGGCAVVTPQTVPPQAIMIDVPLMFLVTAAMLPIMNSGGLISRLEGVLLLSGYGLYVAAMLAR